MEIDPPVMSEARAIRKNEASWFEERVSVRGREIKTTFFIEDQSIEKENRGNNFS